MFNEKNIEMKMKQKQREEEEEKEIEKKKEKIHYLIGQFSNMAEKLNQTK